MGTGYSASREVATTRSGVPPLAETRQIADGSGRIVAVDCW
jgi:hypothetical protein